MIESEGALACGGLWPLSSTAMHASRPIAQEGAAGDDRQSEDPTFLNRWLPKAFVLALLLLVSAVVAQALTPVLRSRETTLTMQRDWTSTKRLVEMELMGAPSYQSGTQALAGEQLNLHPWHGYQEVMLRPEAAPREVQFRCLLGEGAYVYFLFNRTQIFPYGDAAYEALRLSSSSDFSSGFFRVTGAGEFLARQEFPVPGLTPETWHTARLLFEGDGGVALFLDGALVAKHTFPRWQRMHVGFRGGAHKASVDDVVITQFGGEPTIRESFVDLDAQRSTWRRLAAAAFAVQVAVAGLLWLCMADWRSRAGVLISLGVTGAICALLAGQFYTRILAVAYPAVDATVQHDEFEHLREVTESTRAHIMNAYPCEAPPGVMRVVVVGTSQTFGAGATQREETFVNQLSSMLTGKLGREVECIAAAVPGAVSSLLLALYQDAWAGFGQTLTVINLSVNDGFEEDFEENIRTFIAINRERGVDTLLILEATSPEQHADGVEKHAAMRKVAEELGVPCFDMHAALRARVNEGMLWWDVAEELVEPVAEMLEARTAPKPMVPEAD
jgi:lysophospholipase L1-like esterase